MSMDIGSLHSGSDGHDMFTPHKDLHQTVRGAHYWQFHTSNLVIVNHESCFLNSIQ